MRLAWLVLPLLGAAAAAEEEWSFVFANGDRVRGGLAAMRNGTVLLAVPASPRAVAVPFGEIVQADPLQEDAGRPAPEPAQVLRLRDGGALFGRCRAVRRGRIEFEVESLGRVTIHGRDVAELLPGEDALRAHLRSAGPSSGGAPLPPERFDALWTWLGRSDGNVACAAHRELVRFSGEAVPLLDARLRVLPDAPEAIQGWIRALDADTAEARLLAHARLRALGAAAGPQLKAAAREPTSAEARQRIAALVADLDAADPDAPPEPDAEVVRFQRAIRVLEQIGTPEAQAVLKRLANSAPGAPTALDAQAALERLRRLGG
jgi:hypothetical protein